MPPLSEFRRVYRPTIFLAFWISVLLACNAAPLARPPTATPPAPTPTATRAPTATRSPRAGAPAWWDARLALPASFDFQGDAARALWSSRDLDVVALKDALARQAQAAGYQVFTITQSRGAIYEVLCVQGQTALAINLTLGSDATSITAQRVGVMQLQVRGVVNLDLALPLRARLEPLPGSEISIGTAVPSAPCARCEYFVNVHIAPFKGVGNYDSKPGTYLIDAQVIPGGDPDQEDFRWPIGGCVVTVRENSGAFECKQLQNIYDQTKRIDVSGTWQQPPR